MNDDSELEAGEVREDSPPIGTWTQHDGTEETPNDESTSLQAKQEPTPPSTIITSSDQVQPDESLQVTENINKSSPSPIKEDIHPSSPNKQDAQDKMDIGDSAAITEKATHEIDSKDVQDINRDEIPMDKESCLVNGDASITATNLPQMPIQQHNFEQTQELSISNACASSPDEVIASKSETLEPSPSIHNQLDEVAESSELLNEHKVTTLCEMDTSTNEQSTSETVHQLLPALEANQEPAKTSSPTTNPPNNATEQEASKTNGPKAAVNSLASILNDYSEGPGDSEYVKEETIIESTIPVMRETLISPIVNPPDITPTNPTTLHRPISPMNKAVSNSVTDLTQNGSSSRSHPITPKLKDLQNQTNGKKRHANHDTEERRTPRKSDLAESTPEHLPTKKSRQNALASASSSVLPSPSANGRDLIGTSSPSGKRESRVDRTDVDVNSKVKGPKNKLRKKNASVIEGDSLEDEKKKREAVFQMIEHEKEFALLKEKLFNEKITGLLKEIESIHEEMHPDYVEQAAKAEALRKCKVISCERLRDYQIENVRNHFLAEKVFFDTEFEQEKKNLKERFIIMLQDKQRKFEEERNAMMFSQDSRSIHRSLRRRTQETVPAQTHTVRRRHTQPAVVYSIKDSEQLEDMALIQKVSLSLFKINPPNF
eukprot:TRINITY_DN5059_c0_g2_i1.p1 TRINITY_DN5059_c0_g2~~TRINITY_DN5059_c0_g2_i1.p1  ORF type:complete len:659 (+),score=155.94 TRINITY_DN5059_c0_g2_i1:58-2034(+)